MNVLVVDDDEHTRYQLQVLLAGHGHQVETATNGAEALDLARRRPPDLVVTDILMPVMDGFSLCRAWTADERLSGIPLVFYTATYTDEQDRALGLGLGAARFLVKPQEPDDFISAIREVVANHTTADLVAGKPGTDDEAILLTQYNQALVRKLEAKMAQLERANRQMEHNLAELRQAEEALRLHSAALNAAANAVVITDRSGTIEWTNPAWTALTGYSAAEALGKNPRMLKSGVQDEAFYRALWDTILAGRVWRAELVNRRKDSTRYVEEETITPLSDETGRITHFIGIKQDITERRQAGDAMRNSERRYRALFESSRDAIMLLDRTGFLDANHATLDLFGCASRDQFVAKHPAELSPPTQADGADSGPAAEQHIEEAYEKGSVFFEWQHRRLDGTVFPAEVLLSRYEHDGQTMLQAVVRDITQRRRLEAQFQQAQKMEAVGRLAGGVAHDFNNHLTVILGYAELILQVLENHPAASDAVEILRAGAAAKALTHQLLAFSRRQTIQPLALNLNQVLHDTQKMLRRLIGEDVRLEVHPGANLHAVKADPSQIVQVLMNLAINARDAMPDGGTLIVETANVTLDEEYASQHPGAAPGTYVQLTVSDTGSGMAPEIQQHVFEPFFTTKDPAQGTGLGLASAYGIVKQHGGSIWMYSEVGRGTTFKVYLPAAFEKPQAYDLTERTGGALGGTETILVAEDSEQLRLLASRVLRQLGYTVIEASDGHAAARAALEHTGTIHLLFSDVVMPGMGGPALFTLLKTARPDIKVLYASGYTDDAIVHHGVLDPGVALLAKPYTPEALARRIRQTLDAPER